MFFSNRVLPPSLNLSDYDEEEFVRDPEPSFLWLDFDYDSNDSRISYFVDYLIKHHQFKVSKKLVKRCLKCIIINIVRLLNSSNPEWLIYHRGNDYYSKMNKFYNPMGISRKIINVLDVLIAEGYLESQKGTPPSDYEAGVCSKMQPLAKMHVMFIQFDLIKASIQRSGKTPHIFVKDKNKNIIRYERNKSKVTRMESILVKYNNLLKETCVALDETIPAKNRRCLIEKSVHRSFNNGSIRQGGRFYGAAWINMPSDYRPHILINGEKTIELDYSGQHIGLLYALLGYSMPDYLRSDPYNIPKLHALRPLLKICILCAINCEDSMKAWKAAKQKLYPKKNSTETRQELAEKEKYRNLIIDHQGFKQIINEFLNIHPNLKGGLFRGLGCKLQNYDSVVAEYVINNLTTQKIPVLSVHDSFIVAIKHKRKLLKAMMDAYLCSPILTLSSAYTSIKEPNGHVHSFRASTINAKSKLNPPIILPACETASFLVPQNFALNRAEKSID